MTSFVNLVDEVIRADHDKKDALAQYITFYNEGDINHRELVQACTEMCDDLPNPYKTFENAEAAIHHINPIRVGKVDSGRYYMDLPIIKGNPMAFHYHKQVTYNCISLVVHASRESKCGTLALNGFIVEGVITPEFIDNIGNALARIANSQSLFQQ